MRGVAASIQISPVLTRSSALAATDAVAAPRASEIGALTSGLAAGREEAFRKFHVLYAGRLLRYHLVLSRGDEQAAREALQETYLRVARHARKFEQETAFWCWLTVLARSSACDGGRTRQRYWRLIARYARSLISPATTENPADADAELERHLVASLNQLHPLDRALVEGKYLRHASVRDLAGEFGLTPKAVESRLLRARRELRTYALRRMRDEK